MLSSCSLTETESLSFNCYRNPSVVFLGPFFCPFLHQGLHRLLFVLFLTIIAFTHLAIPHI